MFSDASALRCTGPFESYFQCVSSDHLWCLLWSNVKWPVCFGLNSHMKISTAIATSQRWTLVLIDHKKSWEQSVIFWKDNWISGFRGRWLVHIYLVSRLLLPPSPFWEATQCITLLALITDKAQIRIQRDIEKCHIRNFTITCLWLDTQSYFNRRRMANEVLFQWFVVWRLSP